jgi:hypothetical protein
MESIQVVFSLPNVYQGLGEGKGLATATNAGLSLQFEFKDGFVGVLKSGIHTIEIPMEELYSVKLKLGWFLTRLFIRTRSMHTLSSIPGSEAAQVELRVARKDRRAAQALVSILTLSLSEKQLANLTD